jgi:antitoxin MazE
MIKVRRWGNCLGLRIAKGLAEQAQLREGSPVDLRLENGRLVIVPVRRRKRYTLQALVVRMTQDNLHGEIPTGRPRGREAW